MSMHPMRNQMPGLRLELAAGPDEIRERETDAARMGSASVRRCEGLLAPDAAPDAAWSSSSRGSGQGARFETEGGRSKREGRWTTWFDSGKKRSEGGYLDGEMHGPFTLWYESGGKREEGQYVRGRAHGRWIKWDERGVVLKVVEFRHGVKISP